jgi:hypothetical protein
MLSAGSYATNNPYFPSAAFDLRFYVVIEFDNGVFVRPGAPRRGLAVAESLIDKAFVNDFAQILPSRPLTDGR